MSTRAYVGIKSLVTGVGDLYPPLREAYAIQGAVPALSIFTQPIFVLSIFFPAISAVLNNNK